MSGVGGVLRVRVGVIDERRNCGVSLIQRRRDQMKSEERRAERGERENGARAKTWKCAIDRTVEQPVAGNQIEGSDGSAERLHRIF